MNYGEKILLKPKISKIHLSLIRTFRFCQQNSEFEGKFNFLGERKKYYETVVEDIEYLTKKDKKIQGVGKLRSVLQTPKIKYYVKADSFFHKLQEFYIALSQKTKKKLILTTHYPCAIDILPSNNKNNKITPSTLPGSLKEANEIRTSLSLRLYPTGIGSLRFGCFLSTDKKFKIEDIIDFLLEKETLVNIDGEEYSIDSMFTRYADKTISEIIKKRRPALDWIDTHSIIDLIMVESPPSSNSEYKKFFSPLLNLQKNYIVDEGPLENLSNKGDWLLSGKKSMILLFPFASDSDRRKVRRWLRNYIELFSIQKSLMSQIQAEKFAEVFRNNRQFWLDKLKKGILPNDINNLFSLWLYTQLHQCPGTLEKEAWRIRYKKILKVLDEKDKIQKANDAALVELAKIEKETSNLHSTAGKWIKSFIELLNETMEAAAELKIK